MPEETMPKKINPEKTETEKNFPWLMIGMVLIATLFTPLGRIWAIVPMLAGATVLAGSVGSRNAVLISLAALVGGVFHSGSWADFSPSFQLDRVADQQKLVLDFKNIRRLELRGFNGDIRVLTDSNLSLLGQEHWLSMKQHGNIAMPTPEQRGDTLLLQIKRPFMWSNSGANFELHIPQNLGLYLQTSNGNVFTNGHISELFVSTSNGKINILNLGKSNTNLQNQNGEILVQHFSGPLQASTSNNNIQLQDANNSSLELNNSNGKIILERIGLAANSSSNARTSNEQIRVNKLGAPAGLKIRGQSNQKMDVRLRGSNLKMTEKNFVALRDGFGVAELNLETQNAEIVVR